MLFKNKSGRSFQNGCYGNGFLSKKKKFRVRGKETCELNFEEKKSMQKYLKFDTKF